MWLIKILFFTTNHKIFDFRRRRSQRNLIKIIKIKNQRNIDIGANLGVLDIEVNLGVLCVRIEAEEDTEVEAIAMINKKIIVNINNIIY